MNTPLSEQDLIQLNAYLDGEMTAAEHAEIEARLAADERLQAELDSLRVTAALLGMAERVRVPRSFTLDPAVYGQTHKPKWWANPGLSALPSWAAVGVTVLAVLVCGGLLLFQNSMGMMAATSAPAAQVAEEPATEEPAPTEEVMPAAAEGYDWARTEAEPTEAAAEEEATAEPITVLPTAPMALPTEIGGMGGGPPEETVTAASPPGQRNDTESGTGAQAASVSPPLAPGAATGKASTPADKQPTVGSPQPPLPDALYHNYTAVAQTPTPTPTWVDGQLLGLPVKWILVLAGAIIFITGLMLISMALKRRPH